MANVIIGVHGLSNKPPAKTLERWWKKSIEEGLRVNRGIDTDINFRSVYWADVMYPKPDPKPDAYKAAKPGVIKRYKDSWVDELRASSLSLGGKMLDEAKKMFGLSKSADLVLKKKLKDLHTYYSNAAKREELRRRLKDELLSDEHKGKRIMLVAHSMGTIIAYDVLREIGREKPGFTLNQLVTIGSPLGLPHVMHKIRQEKPMLRTPTVVQNWVNMADRRDPVALDIHLSDDYEANERGVKVMDDLVMNDWGGINHKSYGYLRTPEFTDVVRSFL